MISMMSLFLSILSLSGMITCQSNSHTMLKPSTHLMKKVGYMGGFPRQNADVFKTIQRIKKQDSTTPLFTRNPIETKPREFQMIRTRFGVSSIHFVS